MLHNWEKCSDPDLLTGTVSPENDPKIKHNMSPYSAYLNKTNAKEKEIQSSRLQKLDY